MRTTLIAAAALAAIPTLALAESEVTVAPFHAIGLSDGGDVVVRQGAQQRIRVIEGDQQTTRFTVRNGGLEIDNCHAQHRCPRDYRLRVEITVPALTALAVSDGGHIRAEGAFPAQDTFAAAVNDGGQVDARAVRAAHINAAVNEGGNVMVTATGSLRAAVNEGGIIQYWGNPSSIQRAINGGGAIVPGTARGATQANLVAPVPPVPPVPPRLSTRVTHDSDDDYDSDMDEDDYEDMDESDYEDDDSDE